MVTGDVNDDNDEVINGLNDNVTDDVDNNVNEIIM